MIASRVEDRLSIAAGDLPRAAELAAAGDVVRPHEPPPDGDAGVGLRVPRPASPTLVETFATHPRDAGWTRFLAAQLPRGKPLLWVQERMAILEAGRIHPPGLEELGLLDIIHVAVPDTPRLLWTMEEGLRCPGLGGVIGEAWGEHARLDFTATRRLAFASEQHGVACWLMRLGAGAANLSGARWRWRVESRPSAPNPYNPRAPGATRLMLDLFRARGRAPGTWEWADEEGPDQDRLDLAAAPVDRAVGEIEPRQRRRA
ncbi:ImuA family protein [Sphingomicrobium sediminis]|uniref:RecA-like protein n=1 Tax=Sphingomicrobium sediminis TaxID=2950949 RepID=A0A9X2J3P1_9SPHN|nr:hypothetical protein [Sphingomicrobium sediminis]MCM8558250.1 hypothetical protein [Sphingomicrobium sediminis]